MGRDRLQGKTYPDCKDIWHPKDYKYEGRKLEWGKDLSKETLLAMHDGQVFILCREDGTEYSEVLMGSYDEIRERVL